MYGYENTQTDHTITVTFDLSSSLFRSIFESGADSIDISQVKELTSYIIFYAPSFLTIYLLDNTMLCGYRSPYVIFSKVPISKQNRLRQPKGK